MLCRRLVLLFVRPLNVVKRRVVGDPPTPGLEDWHSSVAAILHVRPPPEAAGSGGPRGRWGRRGFTALAWPLDAALPLQGVGSGSLPAGVAFAVRVLGQRSRDLRQTCMYTVWV